MRRFDASNFVVDGLSPGGAASPEVLSRQIHGAMERMIRRDASDRGRRYDDATTLQAAREVEQVLTGTLETVFAPRYARRYVPMVQGAVSPWADRYIQKRVTRSGAADYVTSADMPWADAEMQEVPKKVYTVGSKFGYDYFELQRAMFAGTPLDPEKALASREAAEDALEIIMISGDGSIPTSGLIPYGLINDPTVPTTSALGGAWSGLTADQIIAAVRAAVAVYRANSRRRHTADVLLLPEDQLAIIEMTRIPDTSMTIKQFLLANIAGLVEIDVLPELASAGAGGADRMLMYARDPMVVRGIVPMAFGFVAPETHQMQFVNHGVMRIAGVEWRRPFGGLYVDGI